MSVRLLWVVEVQGEDDQWEPTVYVGRTRKEGRTEMKLVREMQIASNFRLVAYVPGAQRFRG